MKDNYSNNKELRAKLILANKENLVESGFLNNQKTILNNEKDKHVAELIVANEENELALIVANKRLNFQNEESENRAIELAKAYKDLKDTDKKLAFQKGEKEKRSAELSYANKELAIQNEEKEKRAIELTRINLLLEETGRLVKLGGWEIDLQNNKLSWSEVVYQIHEVDADYQPTIESAIQFYVPEAIPVLSAAMDLTIKEGKPYNLDLQLITAKKNKIWVRIIGHAYLINGKIVKIGGMFQEITERKQSEESLLKMRKAINTSGEAIFLTDPDGVFTYINPAFTSLYGFTTEDIIGKTTQHIFKNGVLNKTKQDLFWKTLLNGAEVRDEIINKKKDGTLINIEGSYTPILDEDNKIIGFLGIQRDITERKRQEENLKISQQELRIFAMHLQFIREEEKIALAREIHDDLGQILVALKIDLGLFKNKIVKGNIDNCKEEILSTFVNLSELIDKTIKTTRRIMSGLRPEIIDSLGFIEACKSYVMEFEERRHISCQFESSISECNFDPKKSVALFRILQEALTNIAKHAKASFVLIQLSRQQNKFIMEIIDDGIGFDKNQKVRPDSYGIIGMKERMLYLEGEMIISSNSDKGTSIRVEMPYHNELI